MKNTVDIILSKILFLYQVKESITVIDDSSIESKIYCGSQLFLYKLVYEYLRRHEFNYFKTYEWLKTTEFTDNVAYAEICGILLAGDVAIENFDQTEYQNVTYYLNHKD